MPANMRTDFTPDDELRLTLVLVGDEICAEMFLLLDAYLRSTDGPPGWVRDLHQKMLPDWQATAVGRAKAGTGSTTPESEARRG